MIGVRVVLQPVAGVVSERLGPAGGHPMTADFVEMAAVVGKGLVAAIGIIDPRDPIVPVAGERGGMMAFILDGVKIIAIGVGVIHRWSNRLPGCVCHRKWELDLVDVPGDRIGDVIGSVALPVYHIIDVFSGRVIMLLSAMARKIRNPSHIACPVVNKCARHVIPSRFGARGSTRHRQSAYRSTNVGSVVVIFAADLAISGMASRVIVSSAIRVSDFVHWFGIHRIVTRPEQQRQVSANI